MVTTTKTDEAISAPSDAEPEISLRVESFGAGVQSTVMLFLGLEGLFGDPPDAAIFADTGWEPRQVYEHLAWVQSQVDIPIYVVSNGRNLYDDVWNRVNPRGKPDFTVIPAHLRKPDGKLTIGRRQCTDHYKIRPIQRKIRDLMGRAPRQRKGPQAEQWIGISTDEAHRIKPSGVGYIHNRWPLIEQGFSREDCLAWFDRNFPGRPLVKSSCIGCPYHSDAQWLALAQQDPEGMERTVQLDQRTGQAAG